MPAVSKLPDTLDPYKFHGINMQYTGSEKEVGGECPFCGKDKFSINVKSSLYRCWVCGVGSEKGGGNILTFIRQLWDKSDEATSDYSEILRSRGYVDFLCLSEWGVAQSISTGDWIVPGYDIKGQEIRQLYRYIKIGDKMRLLPTPTLGHTLFGTQPNLFDKKKEIVYFAEGPWDAIALWEALRNTKQNGKGYSTTASPNSSLLASANVVATPGCNVFKPEWCSLFSGKQVRLLFDNDHPNTETKSGPAGLDGMKRIAKILMASSAPPKEIMYLKWGKEGYNLQLKSGYDVRDHLQGI